MTTLCAALKNACAGANALAVPLYDLSAPAAGPTVAEDDTPVERDEAGVPVAWRLFAFGPVSITRAGQTVTGEFTREAAGQIVEYFRTKGTKIPLDSRHFTFALAEKMGVPETTVAELLHSRNATFGFVSLEIRPDGLWVTQAEYHPLAYRLMQEGTMRYFSPVIRGLADGRLRITSVTFTNEPATDGQFSLAAEAEPISDMDALAASLDSLELSANRSSTTQEPKGMNKLLDKLASLLGMDSIALSDDGTLPDGAVEKLDTLAGEVTDLRALKGTHETLMASARDALALGAEADAKIVTGAILGLKAKGDQAEALKHRVDALELEAENGERSKLIQQGAEQGKLTQAMIDSDWLKGQDAAALTAFLQFAPVVVPQGERGKQQLVQPDTVALSDDQRGILAMVGVTDPKQQEEAARL